MILFFDSSALAKRYVQEDGTAVVLDLVRGAETITASRFTWVEITSAVARAASSGVLSHADEIFDALDEDFSILIEIIEATSNVMTHARQIARGLGLRAGDALQLATVQQAKLLYGVAPTFVCSDRKLLTAAQSEGFTVLDPSG